MKEPIFNSEELVDDLDELNEVLPASFSITSYGADYPEGHRHSRISAYYKTILHVIEFIADVLDGNNLEKYKVHVGAAG